MARCEVTYSAGANAFLPESTRLLMLKDDGSVLVHADAGGYKPLKCERAAALVARGRELSANVVTRCPIA